MRHPRGTTLLLFLALFTVGGASAAHAGFIAFKAGVFQPNDKEDGLQGAGDGLAGEISFGGMLGEHVAGDVSLGCYGTDGDLTAVPVTFNLRGVVKALNDRLAFMAGGGVGVYYAQVSGGDQTRDGGGVGFHLAGGVDVTVASHLALGAEAKWSVTQVAFENTGDHGDIDIGGLTYSFVVRYLY